MNSVQLKLNISKGKYDEQFSLLYSNIETARKRYSDAIDGYVETFGDSDDLRIFSAPGRTEIGGNHTDHQHGSIIAASVNLDIVAVVSKNNSNVINIKSKGYSVDSIKTNELEKLEKEVGTSAALIRGVCSKIVDLGYQLGGFNSYTVSDVLKGSGLSSSAAFETVVATIINKIFCDDKIDAIDIAKIGQFAESVYFGKPSGLLDQTASALGGFTFADFDNPSKPLTETINLDIKNFGYTLCVVDTGGNHANLTNDYADISIECKQISNALGCEYLRYIDENAFYSNIASLRERFGDRSVLRAFHFINEQKRVYAQKKALEEGDFEEFLNLVNQSGNSSYDYLQNLYSTSNVREQGLSLGIALTKKFLNGRGACRVHGGGFAGTIQCYIPNEQLNDYKLMIESVFGKNSCHILNVRQFGGYELKL